MNNPTPALENFWISDIIELLKGVAGG